LAVLLQVFDRQFEQGLALLGASEPLLKVSQPKRGKK
jgi:hypothetical protein